MKHKLAVLIIGLTLAGTALASHEHYLQTPGTCVNDIASGQTSKGPGEGGYHQFHHHVHLGTPGTFAFKQAAQVSVGKGTCSNLSHEGDDHETP